jgi:hypothetical protein
VVFRKNDLNSTGKFGEKKSTEENAEAEVEQVLHILVVGRHVDSIANNSQCCNDEIQVVEVNLQSIWNLC